MATRIDMYKQLFPEAKKFRTSQVEEVVFKGGFSSWVDASNLPVGEREILAAKVPWLSYADFKLQESKLDDSAKALLELSEGGCVETVLIKNSKGDWSVCVSTQIGCAMGCSFCATGMMGFVRDLNSDEIVDQYRFWKEYLKGGGIISNIVFMGMGEPMKNYNEVISALRSFLEYGGIAPSHITLSTVGILPAMEKILTDENWPDVRIAISLHSADPVVRRKIIPSSSANFQEDMKKWCNKYLAKFNSRSHYITLEYIMLASINDSQKDALALAKFANSIEKAKVNLISYNYTGNLFQPTAREDILKFQNILKNKGVSVTIRKSLGADILGACGQLATSAAHHE